MEIRVYTPERAGELADLAHDAVHAIAPDIYSPEEKEAWSPTPPDYDGWRERLAGEEVYVAMLGAKAVGFVALGSDGCINLLYTHPSAQGRGVAGALYAHIERLARARALARLYVNASIVAAPFFRRRGFVTLHENRIARAAQVLVNYTMEKELGRSEHGPG